ncbi:MAG: amidohydrolase family protein [Gammaproteobacteria bacterium]
MATVHDLVIRNGTVVDGTGAPPLEADVAIDAGRISRVGRVDGSGREEIDARHRLVTPGFVDIHTHYDAQVTWENRLYPSSDHGVTTIVMGNCAVGIAPCKPRHRGLLAMLVSAVEDIPEAVLGEGIPWAWESFPQYLDALGAQHYDMDIAAMVTHTPLRLYVLGDRGAKREMATRENLARMEQLALEGLRAGAVGVSSSRCAFHRTPDGDVAPVEMAGEGELMALARALRTAGTGIYQCIMDFHDTTEEYSTEFDALCRLAQASGGRPTYFTLLEDPRFPDAWPTILRRLKTANAAGLPLKAQVNPRSPGTMFGFDLSFDPFRYFPSYRELAKLPLAQRLAELRKPEVRARILAEKPVALAEDDPIMVWSSGQIEGMYPVGDPPNYEPRPEESVGARARAAGVQPFEWAYDYLLQNEGRNILLKPGANFRHGNLDSALAMMRDENALVTLGDGGAHVGYVCDASIPTFLLTHWVRDRPGERVPLPWAVNAITARAAAAVGFHDRGVVRPGYKADLNVIDFDRLRLHAPQPRYDLPAGGRRVVQRADGYTATIVAGNVTYRDGEPTAALPGRLVRGTQPAPP